jgi:hypothetical protein
MKSQLAVWPSGKNYSDGKFGALELSKMFRSND